MQWQNAPDIKRLATKIIKTRIFPHVKSNDLVFMRGFGSSSLAIARIWSLPKPWQLALHIKPRYIIEVLAEHFDKLPDTEKEKTLIHELMHIPKTFSGALVSHRNRGTHINRKNVEKMYEKYKSAYSLKLKA